MECNFRWQMSKYTKVNLIFLIFVIVLLVQTKVTNTQTDRQTLTHTETDTPVAIGEILQICLEFQSSAFKMDVKDIDDLAELWRPNVPSRHTNTFRKLSIQVIEQLQML